MSSKLVDVLNGLLLDLKFKEDRVTQAYVEIDRVTKNIQELKNEIEQTNEDIHDIQEAVAKIRKVL